MDQGESHQVPSSDRFSVASVRNERKSLGSPLMEELPGISQAMWSGRVSTFLNWLITFLMVYTGTGILIGLTTYGTFAILSRRDMNIRAEINDSDVSLPKVALLAGAMWPFATYFIIREAFRKDSND